MSSEETSGIDSDNTHHSQSWKYLYNNMLYKSIQPSMQAVYTAPPARYLTTPSVTRDGYSGVRYTVCSAAMYWSGLAR